MKKNRILLLSIVLIVALAMYLYYAGFFVLIRQNFDELEYARSKAISDYEDKRYGKELYALHRGIDSQVNRVHIIKNSDNSVTLHPFWWKEGEKVGISDVEYSKFILYITDKDVDSYKSYTDYSANGVEYLYLHCSENGVTSFRFHVTDTEEGKKYADLVDLFSNLVDTDEQEKE